VSERDNANDLPSSKVYLWEMDMLMLGNVPRAASSFRKMLQQSPGECLLPRRFLRAEEQ
jgi:hypothetical protein